MACVVLGVTGGIAAYKSVEVARGLVKRGIEVKTVMTEHARSLVGPATFRAVTGNPVATALFEEAGAPIRHISLAREADLFIVAPATANTIAKMAHGLADDLLSTTLLAARSPIIVAPAMNVDMYRHPATQENLRLLRERGVMVVGPAEGPLACGEEGEGRMAEPEDIVRAALEVLGRAEVLRGRKVLVTAGGTREPLDPVRFITNRSTGKMGYALAETAKEMGAEVVLISAPTHLEPPPGVEVVNVTTAEDMYGEVMARAPLADAVVMAAAVADFTPAKFSGQKIKKEGKDTLTLELRRTRDILEELGKRKGRGQVLVGFAAETSGLREKGRDKLRSKNLDMLVANDVSSRHTGFASDYNRALLLFENGEEKETDVMPKRDLAALIWKEVSRLLEQAAERASQG